MFKTILVTIVGFCARRPWLVLAIAAIIAAASANYFVSHFAINTDITKLISPKLPWRQREIEFIKAFPKEETVILAVIDAPTPEIAQSAAERLTQRLSQLRGTIRAAGMPTESEFFRRNGLLFLSDEELKDTLDQLSRSAAMLGPLASDPNLRGVMSAISLGVRAVQGRRVTLNTLAPQFDSFSTAVENVLANRPAYFSWREQIGGREPTSRETRQFVEVIPVLDFDALEPGAKATATIQQAAAELKLPEEGVKVRLTGPVPISDDELATLREGAELNTTLTIAAVLFILWMALHSGRIIFAVFVSLAVGLMVTASLGLLMAGAFNPISIAFFVLFVGIGVDFGLQFSVAYRAERYEVQGLYAALVATAVNTGGRLALAALATAAGFLSFTPTAYLGLSELGEIAGAGMIVAFITSITVLPALLRLLNPPAEPHPLGYAFLAPVDRFLERHRIPIVVLTIFVVLAASPLLYWLRFDFNPMDLRSPKVESVSTYLELRKDPEVTGRTAEILAPSLSGADALAKKLSALPEVSRVMTLSTFVPEGQDQKLAEIRETAAGLIPVISPEQTRPAPTDEEVVSSIEATAKALSSVAAGKEGPGAKAADRLSDALTQLAKAPQQYRTKAEAVFIPPLKVTLSNVRESLNVKPISLDTLPPELVSDWSTADGRARLSVSPKGDSNDNEVLRRFVDAVTKIAPQATGEAVGIQRAADAIVHAFAQAALLALISIALLLLVTLRRITDVVLTLFPLVLAAVVTLELCVVLGLMLNYANIIALPVLLGVGVAFKIYYIMAWREGRSGLLASPLTRAVFYSGMTTAVAFGSLWLSNHPGTSSMGQLLALSLLTTMAAAVLFQPLLMGPPRKAAKEEKKPQDCVATREHTS
jgi:hopanoid biosynthesis associated RND transporter like protein HpnN